MAYLHQGQRSRHHGQLPNGSYGIAVNPYRIKDGITGVINLAKLAEVGYDAGYSGGAMFIGYPERSDDIALIDDLIDECYRTSAS